MGLEEARKRRAQQLLEEAFPGATVALELHPFPSPSSAGDLGRLRAGVRAQVLSCEACGLRAGCRAPVPFTGPLRPSFVAVGEAPNVDEDVRGTPFVGRAGMLLKKALKEVGFRADEMTYAYTAACYPNENGKVRAPTDDEMLACRPNLLAQLHMAETRFVLFCGATALGAYRDDLQVSKVHGQVFLWDSKYVVMPVHHPAAVLRNMNLANVWKQDLEKWKYLVRGELDPLASLMEMCSRCAGENYADYIDPDGVPYCTDHWKRYGDSWKAQRSRWTPTIKTKPSMEQGELIT